ncbi:E3 ubiquitin-protein ligase TRIM39-like [Corythoichthys intestinalis]|uniref:E3 ubiquitin-protein ligase TRIM39-like n=1 Tax=Corythoichthys intestinalis TaxID=161448 RepID=UPI0025A546AA|nr:E3 ubiquitin-protein ligase TRIM39-like [Corythoichthys intestinalis]
MAGKLEEDLRCPTCLDFLKDPVVLSCSHSFCRVCVQQWKKDKRNPSCPVCLTNFLAMTQPVNQAVRGVYENFSRASVKSEGICGLHKEELKLFCLDHRELVCIICRDAKIHAGHKFCPLDEASQEHRKKLREGLQDAMKRLGRLSSL